MIYNCTVIFLILLIDKETVMLPITSPEMLGKVLRHHRKALNLTQSEAGEKFNLSQKTISHIESGRPGVELSTLFKLMAALGLEMHLAPRIQSADEQALW